MDLSAVDRSATQGRSWLHRATPVAKLAGLAIVLGAVIASWNVLVLLALVLVLAAVAVSAKLPAKTTAVLAGYPAVFAAIFAFASASDWSTAITIVLKAVTAALAVVCVILSTPYPQVFAPIQRVTPSIVGDALLMTYRATFLLIDKAQDTVRAVRLRAGVRGRHPLRSARAITLSLGSVLLYSIDLAQRDYDVMRIRGYERRLRVAPFPRTSPTSDALVVVGALVLLAASVTWRLGWRQLNPWSWLPMLPALAVLFAAVFFARRTT